MNTEDVAVAPNPEDHLSIEQHHRRPLGRQDSGLQD